jgi:Glycosyl hydrolase family 1
MSELTEFESTRFDCICVLLQIAFAECFQCRRSQLTSVPICNWTGKSENIWDRFCHEGGNVVNDDNGDVACDSYHLYNQDIANLRNLGVTFLSSAIRMLCLILR